MWRVLVVDDDPQIRRQITQGLAGKAVLTCVDSAETALAAFKGALGSASPFDFVLLDVLMPGKDGFEVLRQIRALEAIVPQPKAREVFVIMITTFKDSLVERYNMGWDDFITKPVEIDKLIRHMQALSKQG